MDELKLMGLFQMHSQQIKVQKKSGDILTVEAVMQKKAYINDTSFDIETGDIIIWSLPSGREEKAEVIDANYYEDATLGHIEVDYIKLSQKEYQNKNQAVSMRDNYGVVSSGDNNFNAVQNNSLPIEQIQQLINEIKASDIEDKEVIAQEIQDATDKNDQGKLKKYLGIALSKGAQIATIAQLVTSILQDIS